MKKSERLILFLSENKSLRDSRVEEAMFSGLEIEKGEKPSFTRTYGEAARRKYN